MLIPVILSGGQGSRLWPISNRRVTKPFITLPDGSRLIKRTYERAMALGCGHVITFTNQNLHEVTRNEISRLPAQHTRFHLVLENQVKNTAPVIICAAEYIKRHISPDAVMLVMPADHLIENTEAFAEAVDTAYRHADADALITFGRPPLSPETNYGYIEARQHEKKDGVIPVNGFKEKPDEATARDYIAQGNYFWNMGIFCFSVSAITKAFAQTCPEMPGLAKNAVRQEIGGSGEINTMSLEAGYFSQFRAISIDYAVMEQARGVKMVEALFDWQDMGSWKAVQELAQTGAGKGIIGENTFVHNAADTFIWSSTQKPVAVLGLSGVTVVDAAAGTLIAANQAFDAIKDAYEHFEASSANQPTVRRLFASSESTVDLITIPPLTSYTAEQSTLSAVTYTILEGSAGFTAAHSAALKKTAGERFTLNGPSEITNPENRWLSIIAIAVPATEA